MATRNIKLMRELRAISAAFRRLAQDFARLAPLLATAQAAEGAKTGAPRRRKPRLTPARRAALKVQGKYMGTLRGLTPAQQARVKKVRAASGIRAALALARRLAA